MGGWGGGGGGGGGLTRVGGYGGEYKCWGMKGGKGEVGRGQENIVG